MGSWEHWLLAMLVARQGAPSSQVWPQYVVERTGNIRLGEVSPEWVRFYPIFGSPNSFFGLDQDASGVSGCWPRVWVRDSGNAVF